MKRTINYTAVSFIFSALVSCGDGNESTTKTSEDPLTEGIVTTTASETETETEDAYISYAVVNDKKLPKCNSQRVNQLVYVIDTKKYKYCSEQAEWTDAAIMQGEKGDKGDTGVAGTAGEAGSKGDKGDTGATGDTGAPGAKGDKGDTGATGASGVVSSIGVYDQNATLVGYHINEVSRNVNTYTIMAKEGGIAVIDFDDASYKMPVSMSGIGCLYLSNVCTGTCYTYSTYAGLITTGGSGTKYKVKYTYSSLTSIAAESYYDENSGSCVDTAAFVVNNPREAVEYTGILTQTLSAPLYLAPVTQ